MRGKKCNFEDRQTIDICKMICALLVVSIHIRPFESFSKTLNFLEGDIIARVAVPFFYASASFFLFEKIIFSEKGKIVKCQENNSILLKYLSRIILLYIIWSGIYLFWQIPYWNSIGWTGVGAIIDYIVSFFVRGSVYHFWYFVSLIYGSIILYKLLQILGIIKTFYISTFLYLLKSLIYGYSWLKIPGIEMAEKIWNMFSGVFDGVCLALPFMVVGMLASQKNSIYLKISRYRKLGGVISFCGLVIEASLLYLFGGNNGKYSYIIFTFPLCIFLFSCVLEKKMNIGINYSRRIRKYSTLVFCVHPLVIYFCQRSTFFNNFNSFFKYMCVSSISLLVSIIIVLLIERRKYKLLTYLV